MSTSEENMFARARAALILIRRIGGEPRGNMPTYLGFTSGDHILRDKRGRVWSVDLVTGNCLLCVGLLPAQWKHPPQVAA